MMLGSQTIPNSEHSANTPPAWPEDVRESAPPIPPGYLVGGRYRVESVVSQGGMGVVCLGHHVELRQPVAIKFMLRDLLDRQALVQRFLNEARAAAALRGEHVVRVMDVGQLDSGQPYLVMEYLNGVDLDVVLQQEGPLGVDRTVGYVLQVCEGLEEAHARHIIHRDIKPENIVLVSSAGGRDVIKVVDFGLAKRLDASHALAVTGPTDSLGSPHYMSPEQIVAPASVDARTDIWSLGVAMYRLLTGTLPFDGDSLVEVYAHVLNARPRTPTELRPEIDEDLEAIILQCLEKDASRRPQSVRELADRLRRYLEQKQKAAQRLPSPSVSPEMIVPIADDTKVRVPVHSPWGATLLTVAVVASGVLLGAEHAGGIDVRNVARRVCSAALGDSRWFAFLDETGVSERVDALLHIPRLNASRFASTDRDSPRPRFDGPYGVVARDPVVDAEGNPELGAEPESEASAVSPLFSADDIRQRKDAYGDYLRSNGMVPLREVLKQIDQTPPY